MYPKVSIQIPTYNQDGFIKRTIESCLMQDYANLEINIADDNSADDTYNMIQEYLGDSRIRYHKNSTNLGRVANYHKALYEYATGEWALNLDGDDYFSDKTFISTAIKHITNCNEKDIVVYQANHDINKIISALPQSERINEHVLLVDGSSYFINYYKIPNFYHCATLYKRSKAITLNFYTNNCLFTDFNSVAKLFINGMLLLSSHKVAVWQQHELNETGTLTGNKINNELDAIKELGSFAADSFPAKSIREWRRKMKGYILSNYLDLHITRKQNWIALRYILVNFDLDKVHFKQLIKATFRALGLLKANQHKA